MQGRYESGEISQLPVPDPDLEIRRRPEDKLAGGGGGGGGCDGLQKIFFRPFGPQSGLKIRWGRGPWVPPLDPAPVTEHYSILVQHAHNDQCFDYDTHSRKFEYGEKTKIKRFPQQNPSRPLLASVKSPRLPASAQITCG